MQSAPSITDKDLMGPLFERWGDASFDSGPTTSVQPYRAPLKVAGIGHANNALAYSALADTENSGQVDEESGATRKPFHWVARGCLRVYPTA